jgi:hypothetical protein
MHNEQYDLGLVQLENYIQKIGGGINWGGGGAL